MKVGDGLRIHTAEPLACVLGTTMIGPRTLTPRQRSLVAALVLAGRDGAGIEKLADAVWAGQPPGSARSALQNQMTRLRRTHGEGLILCEHANYRLGVANDVEEFERTVAASRSRPLDRATTLSLAGALTLWRGTPYLDLADCHDADTERARLSQVRADAVELLAIGRITIGDFERCVAELRAEVENDPFRDRVWELLFVALQRAGRPSEAIVAHQDYVRRLRRDLGASPSQELVDIGIALSRAEPLQLCHPVAVPPNCREDHDRGCGYAPRLSRCRTGGSRRTRPAH